MANDEEIAGGAGGPIPGAGVPPVVGVDTQSPKRRRSEW